MCLDLKSQSKGGLRGGAHCPDVAAARVWTQAKLCLSAEQRAQLLRSHAANTVALRTLRDECAAAATNLQVLHTGSFSGSLFASVGAGRLGLSGAQHAWHRPLVPVQAGALPHRHALLHA